MGGFWTSTSDKQSVVILRSDTSLNFRTYTCGLNIQPINPWDTTYHPATVSAPSTAAIVTPISNLVATTNFISLTATSSAYYNTLWPLVIPAFSG